MDFEINKVLNLKVTSIPADNGKSINIEALNDADSRQKLYSLLRVCFDKAGKKKGVLEAIEMKALYNEAGGKIDKQKLSKLLAKFKFALFLYKQGTPQKANKTEQRVKELIGKLKDPDPEVRKEAAEALRRTDSAGRMGHAAEAAIPALINALSDKNESVCVCAGETLGYIGPAAAPALINALSDKNENVRKYAAAALGTVRPAAKAAVPALIQLLSDKNDDVSKNAHWALHQIRKK